MSTIRLYSVLNAWIHYYILYGAKRKCGSIVGCLQEKSSKSSYKNTKVSVKYQNRKFLDFWPVLGVNKVSVASVT